MPCFREETRTVKLPHVQILVDRRDAETVVNGNEDKADDRIGEQHPIQGLPHGATSIIQFRRITQEGPDAESSPRD